MSEPAQGLQTLLEVVRADGFRLELSLEIPPGRTIGLLGPNAAGKSTAVRAIAGLADLAGGSVVLNGRVLDDRERDVFVPAEDRHLGIVFQDYLLFPHMNVIDNVAFPLRSRGLYQADARREAVAMLESVGGSDLARRAPSELSGGQAQRVALARALAGHPQMLLLDEPFAALDVTTRAHLRHMVADHLDEFEGPRLLITHEPTEAFLLADEIHVIEGGRVTQVGTADEIRLQPKTKYIADLAGANLLRGNAHQGVVDVDGYPIHIADESVQGPAILVIQPQAIALYMSKPEGSPRNTWQSALTRIERVGERIRLQVGDPIPLTAEITVGAVEALHLEVGSRVWLAVKATEIDVQRDD